MLPRWHIILGAVLTGIIWFVVPDTPLLYLALFFFSSFLIDFDHYVTASFKTKKYRLKDSYAHYKKMDAIRNKEISKGIIKKDEDFHLFHTVEFHLLVGILSIFWFGFFYVFMGMIFHSLLDIIHMTRAGVFHRREYFFFNWARRKSKKS
jgi:hypothetical protein